MNQPSKFMHSLPKLMLISMLVIAVLNAYLHDPLVGYDVDDHIAYIHNLARGRLPGRADTNEFFSPPLPYLIPAILHGLFNLSFYLTLKFAQAINVFLAYGSAITVLEISKRLFPESLPSRNLALVSLLTLPVWYKTHAFIRPEPYLVFFLLLYCKQLIDYWQARLKPARFAIYSGLSYGAVLLSRQWGALILPAILLIACILLKVQSDRRALMIRTFIFSGLIAILASGWFYISLYVRFGSVIAFNRYPAEHFSFKNKPGSYYFGRGNNKLFSDPIRDSFDNQLIPILYTETWGDYWQYFLVYGKDLETYKPIQGDRLLKSLQEDPPPTAMLSNRDIINRYLGRVNLISMIPSGIAILSFGLGVLIMIRSLVVREHISNTLPLILFTASVIFTFLGYLWFVIQYPSSDGDTLKSSYVLQVFPFMALITALIGDRLKRRFSWIVPLEIWIFLVAFVHNLGAFLTRYLA